MEIIDMVFGEYGWHPNILKMFLDPLHQKERGGDYDHKTTTNSICFFAKSGYELIKKRNDDLSILTTLYGPLAYITKRAGKII